MKRAVAFLLVIISVCLCFVSCGEKRSYEKLDDYIKASAGEGELVIGGRTVDNTEYLSVAKRVEGKIELTLRISEGASLLRTFTLTLDKNNLGTYKWEFKSAVTDAAMGGMIIAKDYKRSASTLDYLSKSGIEDEMEISSVMSYSKGMCNYLLDHIDDDLKSLKLDAEDFGFKDYKD